MPVSNSIQLLIIKQEKMEIKILLFIYILACLSARENINRNLVELKENVEISIIQSPGKKESFIKNCKLIKIFSNLYFYFSNKT